MAKQLTETQRLRKQIKEAKNELDETTTKQNDLRQLISSLEEQLSQSKFNDVLAERCWANNVNCEYYR